MPRSGDLRQAPEVSTLNDDAPNLGDQPRFDGVTPDHAPVTGKFQI
jgi:hypothetical protein